MTVGNLASLRKKAPRGNYAYMSNGFYDVYNAACPTRAALDRIADKWTALIIRPRAERPRGRGELKRRIGGISQKMLTQTLRSLERDGLVLRQAFATVPVT